MAILSGRVGGSEEFPIYRVTETRADGMLVLTFELHGPQGLQRFATWSQAQEVFAALQGNRARP